MKCLNFDGGFGCIPGAESHSGQVKIWFIFKTTCMSIILIFSFRLDLLLCGFFVNHEQTAPDKC